MTQLAMDDQFCPKCGSAWATHNGDGSCVEDTPIEYPKVLDGNNLSNQVCGFCPSGRGPSYLAVMDKEGRYYRIRADEALKVLSCVMYTVTKKKKYYHLTLASEPVPDSAFGFSPGPSVKEQETMKLWEMADTLGHDEARKEAARLEWRMVYCRDCKEIAPFVEADTSCLFCGRQLEVTK